MNKMELRFSATLENSSFARTAIAAFMMSLNPNLEEIEDVKTIVSEAVSNAIEHGYGFNDTKYVYLKASINKNILEISIQDYGVGIKDIAKAMEATYSTNKGDSHAGMGFTIMKAFSDDFKIYSTPNIGTKVIITKIIEAENILQ